MFGMMYFGYPFPGWSPFGIDVPYISPIANLYVPNLTSDGMFEALEINKDSLYIQEQNNSGAFERLQ